MMNNKNGDRAGNPMPPDTAGVNPSPADPLPAPASAKSLRLLIVDDSEADALLLAEEIKRAGYELQFERVDTPETMTAALDRGPWDVILTDHNMPRFDSLGVLKLVHQKGLDLPFIVVTGSIGEEAAVAILKAGAHDLILKNHYARLVSAIEREQRDARLRQEQQRTEAELQRSEHRLQLALTSARLDLWEWDMVKDIVYWSEHAYDTFGMPRGHFEGKFETIMRMTHPDDREAVQESLKAALEDREHGGFFDIDMRIIRPDGTIRCVHSKSQVLRDGQGKPVRIVGIGMDITERKKAEEALRSSEERFEKAFRHSPSLMMISTLPEGRILDINDAFAHGLGYAGEEILGRTEEDVGIWADSGTRSEILCRLREDRDFSNFEVNLLHKSGSLLAGLCSGVTIEVDGKPGLLMSVTDISERKWVEEALRESENRFRLLATKSPNAILMQDKDLRYIGAFNLPENSFTVEQVLGKTDYELFPRQEAEDLTRIKKEVMRTALGKGIERHLTMNGVERAYDVWYEPRFGSGNEVKGITLYCRDITERKRVEHELAEYRDHLEELVSARTAELTATNARLEKEIAAHQQAQQALRKSEALYRQLVETSPDPIFLVDLRGTIQMVNQKALELNGAADSGEIVGKSMFMFVCHEDQNRAQEAYQTVQQQGSMEVELNLLKKDGSRFPGEVHASLVQGENGLPNGVIGVIRDVSEHHRMEVVGRLASGLALNINNVLSPILLGMPLLHGRLHDKEGQSILATVEASAQRAAGIIRQLLAIAQGLGQEKAPLHPQQIIREAAGIIQETFPSTIGLQTAVAPNLWPVCGDSAQLHQAILGLCLNAREAMPGGGQITLRAENIQLDAGAPAFHPAAKPGPYVVIIVADTGQGYTAEARARILACLRAERITEAGQGQTLGTVVWIVRNHGGFITLDESHNSGTTYKVYLPAQMGLVPAQFAATSPPEKAPVRGQGEMILVVDDEQIVRDMTEEFLVECGFKVVTAADGPEAIARYVENQGEIKLVLMDMVMPYLDGIATLQALRKINPQIRSIIITGMVSARQEFEMKRSRIDALLPKPFTSNELLNAIQAMLASAVPQNISE